MPAWKIKLVFHMSNMVNLYVLILLPQCFAFDFSYLKRVGSHAAQGPLVLKKRIIKLADFEKWMHSPTPEGHTVQCRSVTTLCEPLAFECISESCGHNRLKRDKDTGFFDLYLGVFDISRYIESLTYLDILIL
eukprot:SAG31_NODE_2133_length_6372_cov_4.372071_9_plen_133_part_00